MARSSASPYGYNDLDDARKPTTGSVFTFSQDFAGFGGNLRYHQVRGILRHLSSRSSAMR